MRFKIPTNDAKYEWTRHSVRKMMQYGLTEQRVRRVIHSPKRTEEGVAENTIAVMQPSSVRKVNGEETWPQEIWVMYQLRSKNLKVKSQKWGDGGKKIIITAWRYPGVSKARNAIPIPQNIIDELLSEGML